MSHLLKRKKRFAPGAPQIVVLGFLFIILIGALLLHLPFASADGQSKPFLSCLFTATSAACVTGLSVFDAGLGLSLFGKAVLLVLIQLGGLGFMTVAAVFSLFLKRNFSLRAKNTIVQTLNLSDYTGMRRLLKHILLGTLVFETAGALILFFCFFPRFGFGGALLRGVFTSVSAFCNAGFDINGLEPFGSFLPYADDPVVCITLSLLILLGGIGFFVWEDLYTARSWKKLSLFSRIVLLANFILILSGTVLFFLSERRNPQTIGGLPFGQQALRSFFQAVTYRTAGFSTVDFARIEDPTAVLSCVYMFIGGSSGSTAGGIKVTTMALLFFAFRSVILGRGQIVVFGRRIPVQTVLKAFTLCVIGIVITVTCSVFICHTEGLAFVPAFFECVSAFGTVGLTMGLTPGLSALSLCILIVLMFFGRLGVLTITYVVFVRRPTEEILNYPETDVAIG